MTRQEFMPFVGALLAIMILLVVLLRFGLAGQAKRSRVSLLESGTHLGVLIAETDISTTHGLRSAFPELRNGSAAEIVPWRFLVSWNGRGIQFWSIGKSPELLATLPWGQISLAVSRIRLGRSVRVALDIQLSTGPIHLQPVLRHESRGLPYYSIEELNRLLVELRALSAARA